MKQIVINVEATAFECVVGVLRLMKGVEVVSGEECEVFSTTDQCFAKAVSTLRQRRVFRYPCDYTYIMMALNEELVKGMPFFYSPKEFIDYMKSLGIDKLPGKSTLYDTMNKIGGRFPNWSFNDHPKETEALRRKNVVKQFLSAFGSAKRGMLEG